jgi:hypothetical protein
VPVPHGNVVACALGILITKENDERIEKINVEIKKRRFGFIGIFLVPIGR